MTRRWTSRSRHRVGPGRTTARVGDGWRLRETPRRGHRVTTLTLAKESERYLNDPFEREGLSGTVRVVR